ncbi:MAG: hypothetical protein QW170_00690 [Desulfurococcaceae archaeon]
MSWRLDYHRIAIPALCILLIGFVLVYSLTIHYYNSQIRDRNEKIEGYKRTIESLMMENLSLRNEISRLKEESANLNLTIKWLMDNNTRLLNELNRLNEKLSLMENEKNMLMNRVSYLEKMVRLELKTTLFNQTIELREIESYNYRFKLEYPGYTIILIKYLSSESPDIPRIRINVTSVFHEQGEGYVKIYETVFEIIGFGFERKVLIPVLPGYLALSMELLSGSVSIHLSITYTY